MNTAQSRGRDSGRCERGGAVGKLVERDVVVVDVVVDAEVDDVEIGSISAHS